MKKVPCFECEERTETCHSTCEAYLEWSKARNEMLVKRFEERQNQWALSNHRDRMFRRRK